MPPGTALFCICGKLDDAFLFELRAQRIPDAGGGRYFGGKQMRGGNDGGKLFDQALTGATTGEVGTRRFRHGGPALLFEDDVYCVTLHDRSLRGTWRGAARAIPVVLLTCTSRNSTPKLTDIVAQSPWLVCVFAACRTCLACSRTSSCSKSRSLVRALCSCDLELPTEQPMIPAISLCS